MPTLEHDGATLHYEVHGSRGEPILCIQGIGVVGNGWRPQVKGLAGSYRLLTFDNRGIGASTEGEGALTIERMAEDAAALVAAAGWESCHVVGHSMGGVIAQRLAIARPRLVRSLTLLCTVSRGRDAVRMTPGMMWVGLRTRVGTRRMRRRAFLGLIYPRASLAGRDTDALARELAPLFGRDLAEQPPIIMKQAMALRAHDCTAELASLAGIHTRVVSAEHDPIAPARFGRALAAAIPGARFTVIAGASHGVVIERAAEINAIIAEVVRSG